MGSVVEEVAMRQAYFRIIPPVQHPHTCIYYRRYINSATDSVFKGTTLKQNSQFNWNSEPGRVYYICFVNIVTDEGHGRVLIDFSCSRVESYGKECYNFNNMPNGISDVQGIRCVFSLNLQICGSIYTKAHTHKHT